MKTNTMEKVNVFLIENISHTFLKRESISSLYSISNTSYLARSDQGQNKTNKNSISCPSTQHINCHS